MLRPNWETESKQCFYSQKYYFFTNKNGGTHHATSMGLVWKDPKGFFITVGTCAQDQAIRSPTLGKGETKKSQCKKNENI